VRRLATLFAVDAGGGGLATASFLAYYVTVRYQVTPEALGVLFFATSLVQAGSVWLAPRLADWIGLVPTMFFTYLPSNILRREAGGCGVDPSGGRAKRSAAGVCVANPAAAAGKAQSEGVLTSQWLS